MSTAQEAGSAAESSEASTQDESTADETPADGGNAGQADLDAAVDARIGQNDITALEKVIELTESAMKKGLDEGNQQIAKQLLASASLERGRKLLESLQTARLGERATRRLIREITQSLEKAVENDPALGEAHLLLGRVYAVSNEREKAREAFGRAAETAEEDSVKSDALTLRGLLREDDADGQREDFEKAIELNDDNVAAWQGLLKVYLEDENREKAVETIRKFLETDSDNPVAVAAALESLVQLGESVVALDYLDKLVEGSPEDPKLRQLRAQARLANDNVEAAIEDLNAAIEKDGDDALSYLLRSQAALLSDPPKYDLAERDVDRALDLAPNSIAGLQFRASIAASQQRYGEAIADIQLLVRNDPQNVTLLRQLGTLYQADKRPSEAIKVADAILQLESEDWEAHRLRGDALLSIGKQKEAIADYESAIAKLPEDAEASGLLNNLSWVLSTSPNDEVRDAERALELAKQAAEATEYKAAYILSTLAAAYAEGGDFEKAREWSAKAVELAEKDEEGLEDGEESQLPQLRDELEHYKQDKPYRELQETEENDQPNVQIEEGVEA